jgi:DNA (cytosine-5)-methyltransferase 1
MRFSCVDCFSGAGGLSLGLKRAGFDILFSFDIDPRCIESQLLNKKYFGHEVSQSDINDMLNGNLLKKIGLKQGELFLLAGGPPCQGFSVQRVGPDHDKRNNLVMKYIKLIGEVLPNYFLMENVPGILGKRGQMILKKALTNAEKLGYYIHEKVLDAQDYGIPQRRKRVFIVGERLKEVAPAFTFPSIITPPESRITVRQIIGNLPPPPEDGSEHPSISHHRRDKLSEINRKRLLALKPGEGRDQLPKELLADCHRISSSVIGHRNVYGRMSWDEVAPTITARFDSFTRGLFGHPEQIRSISLREGALFQTFPIDFIFSGNKVDIARQIGNAVPPLLAEIFGKQLIACQQKKGD